MRLRATKVERNGFIVVVVLCMVMMLEVLLLSFNYKSRADLHAVDDLQRYEQALNCARAGLNIAIAAIRDTADIHTNRALRDLLSGESAFTVGNGKCSITIAEESGKLNVNLLKDKSGELNRTRVEQLLRLIDVLNREYQRDLYIGYGIVPSIIDWIDSDDQVTSLPFIKFENTGAESDYYSGLDPSYRCKNGPFDTIGELLLIKGMTPQIFDRIRDYVTVRGGGKININCASKRVIESLTEKMDAVLAQMIVDRRKTKPFDSITELQDVPGMTDSIYQTIAKIATVSPADRHYHVTARGNVDHISCTIVALLRRNIDTKNVEVILYEELQE